MGLRFLLNGFLLILLIIQPIPEVLASVVPTPEVNFNTGSSYIQNIFIMDDILFTAERYDGFRMVNVSDPSDMDEIWHFPLTNWLDTQITIGDPGILNEAQLVHVVNNTAFFTSNNELYIFNIINPREPVLIGILDLFVHSMASKNNFLYILVFGGILVIDISDPLIILSTIYNDNIYFGSMELAIENDFLFINQYNSISIYDLSNTTPIFTTSYEYKGNRLKTTFVVSGNLVALVEEQTKIQFLNITDLENIVLIKSLQLKFYVNSLAIIGKTIFIAITGSLKIYDITDLKEISLIKEYSIGSLILGVKNCDSITISDEIAYLNTGVYGVRIIDISDSRNIKLLGVNDPFTDYYSSLYYSDEFLYVNSPYDGLQLFSINEQQVEHIDNYNSSFTDIEVQGDLAFLATDLGLQIIDISNKSNVEMISSYENIELQFAYRKMEIQGNLVFLTTNNGFMKITIDDINNPLLIHNYLLNYNFTDIVVENDIIYLVGEDGLKIYKEVEGEIILLSNIYEGTYTSDLIVNNDRIYVWNRYGISILDISIPEKIEFLGKIDILDMGTNRFHFTKFELHDNFLIVLDDLGYIEVYDISIPEIPSLVDQSSLSVTDTVAFIDFTIYDSTLIVIGSYFGSIYDLKTIVPNFTPYGDIEEKNLLSDYLRWLILIVILLVIVYFFKSRKKL